MAEIPMELDGATKSNEQKIPTDATIYLSYVLGDATERANRIVLDAAEVRSRMRRVKAANNGFLLVTKPENRPAYDAYVTDVRFILQKNVKIKQEPISDGESAASTN